MKHFGRAAAHQDRAQKNVHKGNEKRLLFVIFSYRHCVIFVKAFGKASIVSLIARFLAVTSYAKSAPNLRFYLEEVFA